MKKTNVLVLSFEALNKESSNGRSLGSLILPLKDKINFSQIYIKGPIPTWIEGRYLLIDERQFTRPLRRMSKKIKILSYDGENIESNLKTYYPQSSVRGKKSIIQGIIRNIVWNYHSLFFKKIYDWIKLERPDIIILQDSSLPFFDKFALKIQKRTNCKLVLYTTEDYCLKQNSFFARKVIGENFFFKHFYHKKFFKIRRKLLARSSNSIYLTKSLMDEYTQNFSTFHDGVVIMPNSSMKPFPRKKFDSKNIVLSYCGSLGHERFLTILDLINSIDKHSCFKLILASKLDKEQQELISSFKCVDYRGYVSYEEVVKIYEESDIILQIDAFDEENRFTTEHAFSGKLGDCICSLKPFLYIGPSKTDASKFLSEERCAFQINERSKIDEFVFALKKCEVDIYKNESEAKEVARRYFSSESNEAKIEKIILSR